MINILFPPYASSQVHPNPLASVDQPSPPDDPNGNGAMPGQAGNGGSAVTAADGSAAAAAVKLAGTSPPKTMKTFRAYLPSCHRTYSCVHCRAHLANHDELISKSFQVRETS